MIEQDPSSTAGVINIMEALQQHVPDVRGEPLVTMCGGDGLSVERMVHAKRARINAVDVRDQLRALQEAPQEFHKEMLLLQVRHIHFIGYCNLL